MRWILWIVGACFVASCGGEELVKTDPCPNGLCGGSGGGSSSSSGGGCVEAWTCTPWQQGADGQYSRTCTDGANCGTAAAKPPTGPVALPALDKDFFMCKVEPILDRGCSMLGCHGTEQGRAFKVYSRGRLRRNEVVAQVSSCPIGPQQVNLAEEGSGTVMCVGWSPHTAAEWQQNFDNSRSFMLGISNAEESDLLAQPVVGGKAHAGVHMFAKTDLDYTTIKSWLEGAKLGSACNPLPN
ncbi:MAG TPA: hypothetical protein PK156_12655 [Polyangium sp.]|nr:hypothetical protein [Polyangium sp.]